MRSVKKAFGALSGNGSSGMPHITLLLLRAYLHNGGAFRSRLWVRDAPVHAMRFKFRPICKPNLQYSQHRSSVIDMNPISAWLRLVLPLPTESATARMRFRRIRESDYEGLISHFGADPW